MGGFFCAGASLDTISLKMIKATMSAHYSGMVALFIQLLFQRGHQLVEAIQCGLQIFDDIRSQFVGIG